MKLVRQVRLRSVQGTTTAVFEVDLCEVGTDRFVVNFRHGKRGGALTDGSKTVLPVGREEAERIFNKLVQEKKRKGYVDVSAGTASIPSPAASVTPTVPSPPAGGLDARGTRLMGYLFSPDACPPHFPLHRVIWRVGELRLREAAPQLVSLLESPPRRLKQGDGPPWQHGLVWSLSRCGDSATAPALAKVHADDAVPDSVRRLARVGLLDVLEGEAKATELARARASLPAAVAEALTGGPDALPAALARHLAGSGPDRYEVLATLYLLEEESARAALLDLLRTIPLERPAFRTVRHLFKAAEMRGDGQVFGILTWRFEQTRATSNPRWWWDDEERRAASYTTGTRRWLRRRTWRTARRLGSLGVDEFVDLAMGVLLAVSDEDGPGFERHWAFAQLLHSGGDRFRVDRRGLCLRRVSEGPRTAREEAFPKLWDRHPEAFVALMSASRCAPVHAFAARGFRDHEAVWAAVPNETLIGWLGLPYAPTAELAVDLVVARHDPMAVDVALTVALANCGIARGRAEAHRWISAASRTILGQTGAVVQLVTSPHADTRAVAKTMLSAAALSPDQGRQLIAQIIAELVAGTRDDALLSEVTRDVTTLLQTAFSLVVRSIGLEVIRDLLEHPQAGVQQLGADLLLGHDIRPPSLPPDLIATVMLSAHAQVRTIGVRLFGELPDATLIARFAVLVDLCTNPHADVRQAVRPIIGRLARANATFGLRLLEGLVDVLAKPEPREGLHADVLRLVREELAAAVTRLDVALIWKLLHAPTTGVQELGGELLQRNVDPASLELWRIAKLGNHEVLAVREAAWAMLKGDVARVKRELESALLVLDADWEDTRNFGFAYFEENFGGGDFTPELLVSVCDSVRPDVQQYGRRLLTKFFQEDQGPLYLQRLSQHPTGAMQLFATNYLERFAAGDAERIEGLESYFVTVLTAVNRGRVAKSRVLAFLRQEALANERVARMVAGIRTELSLTIAVEYRAAAIELLNAIRRTWPAVPVPLKVRTPEKRGARAV